MKSWGHDKTLLCIQTQTDWEMLTYRWEKFIFICYYCTILYITIGYYYILCKIWVRFIQTLTSRTRTQSRMCSSCGGGWKLHCILAEVDLCSKMGFQRGSWWSRVFVCDNLAHQLLLSFFSRSINPETALTRAVKQTTQTAPALLTIQQIKPHHHSPPPFCCKRFHHWIYMRRQEQY